MTERTSQSAALARVLPFLVFIGLSFFQDMAGEAGRYWMYLAKAIAATAALLVVRKRIEELRLCFSVPAVLVGAGVLVMWVGIDGFYPSSGEIYAGFVCPLLQKIGLSKNCAGTATSTPWNPNMTFGTGSPLAIFFIAVRICSASLLVPIIEELFWRSFVYRFLANAKFDAETLGKFYPVSFVVTSILFGVEHREWLAGILCGCAYQGLVIWKKRLGDAIVAHGITNLLLAGWVLWQGAWRFW